MNKYICWYAYQGMETEGRLDLEEPKLFETRTKAEAFHKYLCYLAVRRGAEPYHKTLTDHLKSEFNEGGWGYCVRQLHDGEPVYKDDWFESLYLSKGYNL